MGGLSLKVLISGCWSACAQPWGSPARSWHGFRHRLVFAGRFSLPGLIVGFLRLNHSKHHGGFQLIAHVTDGEQGF